MYLRHKNLISKLYISLAVAIGILLPVSAFGVENIYSIGKPTISHITESNAGFGQIGDQNNNSGDAGQSATPVTPGSNQGSEQTSGTVPEPTPISVPTEYPNNIPGNTEQLVTTPEADKTSGQTDVVPNPSSATKTDTNPVTENKETQGTAIEYPTPDQKITQLKENPDLTTTSIETGKSLKSENNGISAFSEKNNPFTNNYTKNNIYSPSETSQYNNQSASTAANTQTNAAPAQQTESYVPPSAVSVSLDTPVSQTQNQLTAAQIIELIITSNNVQQNLSIVNAAAGFETAYTQIINIYSGNDQLVKDLLEKPIAQISTLAQSGAHILRCLRSAGAVQALRPQTNIVTALAKDNYFIQSCIFISKQSLLSSGAWANSIQLLHEQISRKVSSGYEIKEFKKLGGLFLNRLLPVLKFTIAAIDNVVMNALENFNGNMPASSGLPDSTPIEGLPAACTAAAKPDIIPATYALGLATVKTLNTCNINATAFINTNTIINAVNYTKTGLSPPADSLNILPYQTVSSPLQNDSTFILFFSYQDRLIPSNSFNSIQIADLSFITSIATVIKTDCDFFVCLSTALKFIKNQGKSAKNSLNWVVFYKNAPQKQGGNYVS
jgi:hypothetical protein